jgi:hypothetical protein
MTDSGPSGILKGMKGQRKTPWIPHGNERRFIEKALHGMKKDNEREARVGSLASVKRDMRARLQIEHPHASPAEIEAIIERRCGRGMKSHQPASNLARAVTEENLVSEKDRAKEQRPKAGRRRR